MKTLNDYLALSYRMEIIRDNDEGGFVASYPDLPGCITCGETEEEALKNALDAKKAWLEAALEENIEIPEPDSLEAYSGQFKLRLPFCSLKGLGGAAADALENVTIHGEEYLSIEELQQASGVGSSIIDRLRQVGALGDLPESSQVSFF